MSERRRFVENLGYSGLSAATNGLAFLLILYASQVLTTESMGVFFIALNFAAIGEPLMDFGLHQASIRHIARDRGAARHVLANSIPMKALSGLGMFAALGTVALAWYPAAAMPALLMLGSAVIRSYLLTIRGVLQGLEAFHHDAVVMFADRALMLAGGVAALAFGYGVPGLALSFVITRALALAIGLVITRTHVERVHLAFDTALWRDLRHQAVPLGAFLLVLTVYNYVDQLLLVRILSIHAPDAAEWDAGVYGNVYKIYEALTYGSGILASVLTPRFAALWANDRDAHRRLAWRGTVGAFAAGAALAALTWLAAPTAITVLYPPDYLEGVRALRWLALGLPLVFAIWILHAIAMSIFDAKLLIRVTLVSLVVNVGANLWLIPSWHRDGAAAATGMGEAVAFVMLALALARRLRHR